MIKHLIIPTFLFTACSLVAADVNLFSDSFNRANNTNIDASSTGMSGTLWPMVYVEREEVLHANVTEALLLSNIENNQLHLADGPNMSVVYLDHNFTDAAILAAGGMKIGLTILSNDGTLVDGGRYIGFGVGSTLAQASIAQFDFTTGAASAFRGSVSSSTAGHSDFYVDWNTKGYLDVFKNGPTSMGGQNYTIPGMALSGNDRLELELAISDFNSGSTVYANILWNSTIVHSTSFQWDYTNANYIGITVRQNDAGFTVDDLEITAAPVRIISDFTSTPGTVDNKRTSSTVTLSWKSIGLLPGMTYAVTADKPVVFPDHDDTGTAVNGQASILADINGTLGDVEFTVTLFNDSQPLMSQKTTVKAVPVSEPSVPNVVVILLDDVGWSDIGCYGSEIQTPNIDSLAAGGIRFRNFYQAARCSPSRMALLSGLYTQQAAVDPSASLPSMKDHGHAGANNVTIAEVLKTEGYRTYMAGKWHLGLKSLNRDPISRGFMHVFGCGVNADEALDEGPFGSWMESSYNLVSTNNEIAKRQYAAQGLQFHTSDAIGDYSVDFIDHHVKKGDGKPFFLYMPFIAAHWPINAPAQLANKYTDIGDPNPADEDVCLYEQGWDVIRQQKYNRQLAMGVIDSRFLLSPKGDHPDPVIPIPDWSTLGSTRRMDLARRQALYAAMLDQADANIGKVIQKLRSEGLLDNTLIFLCF
jgi:hypothetical protein